MIIKKTSSDLVPLEIDFTKSELLKFHWKKSLFSSKYELFSQNKKIGELNGRMSRRALLLILPTKTFKFQKRSFFSSEIEIIDLKLNKTIGSIKFNFWSNKAKLNIEDKRFEWKYENFWRTKWSISENGFSVIKFKKNALRGQIKSKIENELLLFCGLLIYGRNVTRNYA